MENWNQYWKYFYPIILSPRPFRFSFYLVFFISFFFYPLSLPSFYSFSFLFFPSFSFSYLLALLSVLIIWQLEVSFQQWWQRGKLETTNFLGFYFSWLAHIYLTGLTSPREEKGQEDNLRNRSCPARSCLLRFLTQTQYIFLLVIIILFSPLNKDKEEKNDARSKVGLCIFSKKKSYKERQN